MKTKAMKTTEELVTTTATDPKRDITPPSAIEALESYVSSQRFHNDRHKTDDRIIVVPKVLYNRAAMEIAQKKRWSKAKWKKMKDRGYIFRGFDIVAEEQPVVRRRRKR